MSRLAPPVPVTVVQRLTYANEGRLPNGVYGLTQVWRFIGEMPRHSEGVLWVHGHITENDPEGQAMLAAWALTYSGGV